MARTASPLALRKIRIRASLQNGHSQSSLAALLLPAEVGGFAKAGQDFALAERSSELFGALQAGDHRNTKQIFASSIWIGGNLHEPLPEVGPGGFEVFLVLD